jgi:TldD protein
VLFDSQLAKDVMDYALSKGADFAELFIEKDDKGQLEILGSKVHQVSGGIDFGIGLRIIFDTKVLYAYTNSAQRDVLMSMVDKLCIKDQKERQQALQVLSQIAPPENYISGAIASTHEWQGPIDFMMQIDKSARSQDKRLTQVKLSCLQRLQEIEIYNSEGLHATDQRPYCRLMSVAMASENGEQSTGSQAPGVFGHWNAFHERYNNSSDLAQKIVHEAITTLKADPCPAGRMPVVLSNAFGGVIFHEACGHLLETTSVQKKASVFHDKMNQQIASSVVSAVDDGTINGAWGSIGLDDEGAPAQKTQLIKDGKLTSFLVDKVGALKTGYERTGSGRRQSYRYAPASRMRNTYIEAGKDSFDDMISSIEKGIFCQSLGGGSVQPGTGEFNFAAEETYMIENGKITRPLKGATLIGTGPEVLQEISMVGDNLELAAGTCGSVSGSIPVTVGQPPIKIDSILVGGNA